MGIGSKMLSFLENSYKGQYDTIGLEVVKENLKAFSFYTKLGFSIKEDRGKKYLMHKTL